jgi:hypothetical protein
VIIQTGRRLNAVTRRKLREEIGGQPGAMRILQKSADVGELVDALRRVCGFTSDPAGELAADLLLAANAQAMVEQAMAEQDRHAAELECR